MNNTKLSMTAQTPSAFGMPISGHAFGSTTPATDVCSPAWLRVVRERTAAIAGTAKADMGLAQSYSRGTTAWRPPTC
jgi:hypothetical protein